MSQTSYSQNQPVAVAGLQQDCGFNDVISRVAEEAIEPGRLCIQGSSDVNEGCLKPSAAADITTVSKVRGVSVRDLAFESNASDELIYAAKDLVGCLRNGRIYVEMEDAFTPQSDVYVRYSGKAQVQTITFDADLVTSNKINMKLDGVAITEVDFVTDHATTMAAIGTELEKNNKVASTSVGGGSDRVLTVTCIADVELAITEVVVTGGASQAGAVVAETVTMILDSKRGSFRTDADSTTAAALASAAIMNSGSAGEFAELQLKNL